MILSLDGLCPEGGDPPLWVVRELHSGLTLRSGWLSQQDEATFVHFLQPIADLELRVVAVRSDKRGFNIYRSATPDEHGLKVNSKLLLPGAAPGEIAEYTYTDILISDVEGTPFYWLEMILGQASNWSGPFSPIRSGRVYLPIVTRWAR